MENRLLTEKEEIVLAVEQEDDAAGRRDAVEQIEELVVGEVTEVEASRDQCLLRRVFDRLPAVRLLEMCEGDAGGDTEAPRAEDGRLAQIVQFAKDLNRGFLQDVVGKVCDGEPADIGAQWPVRMMQQPLASGAISALGQ